MLGYGYNSIQPKLPSVFTQGLFSEYSQMQESYRDALIGCGFVEVMAYVFTSPEKAAKALTERELVKIKNPVSNEYTALRSSLLPGLLEVLSKNKEVAYPQKIFEIGEVLVKDEKNPTKTRTDLHLCALIAHKDASLTEAASAANEALKGISLKLRASKQFIHGRTAAVYSKEQDIGMVGEIHPQLLENYGLEMPVAGFEVTLRKGTH